MRTIYVAGVNRRALAEVAAGCAYWLLSFGSLPRRWPIWLDAYLAGRSVLWDPGTFAERHPTYEQYCRLLADHAQRGHEALAYDVIGDGEQTSWYLRDMQRRGLPVTPIWQRGMDSSLLESPRCAVGGLVPLTPTERAALLASLFWHADGTLRPVGRVHLLGMGSRGLFAKVPAISGDSRSWLGPWRWNRQRSMTDWMAAYGKQWIPLQAQGRFC